MQTDKVKWKTGIFNINLIIVIIGFMFAEVLRCMIDKSYGHLLLFLAASILLAFLMTFMIAKSFSIYTDDQGIEYRYMGQTVDEMG